MALFEGWSWISLLLSGSIAVILSWVASGCRVGDQVVAQPNPDQYSGFYLAQPQELKFTATTDKTLSKDAPLSSIPTEIGQYISNPVAFLLQDLKTGSAVLADPAGSQGFPITFNPDLTLTYQGTTTPSTFWHDKECQTYLEVLENGTLSKTVTGHIPAGNTRKIMGEIHLTVQVNTLFNGNCRATFQSLANCYQDASQCEGSSSTENLQNQSAVIENFRPLLESETITPADIANLVNYSYEVSYQ